MFAAKNELFTRPSGYTISRSVRLRSSASAYFNRTFGTPTSTTTWSLSWWVKRGNLTANAQIFSAGGDFIYFGGATLVIKAVSGAVLETSQVFRDPSAWYHFLVVADTTNATADNRVKFYVNGSQVTAFSSRTNPSQNAATIFNAASSSNRIGGTGSAEFVDGYLTEINFIDGQALTPSSFGQTNSITGVWQPIKYSGTYGNNGFYLNFSDNSAATAAAIGKDYSGNGNNWTPNNISVTSGVTYDSMTDVPTLTSATAANYCVINPLDGGSASATTVSDGNLKSTAPSLWGSNSCTMGVSSGKWYWEQNIVSGSYWYAGIIIGQSNWSGQGFGQMANGYSYYSTGQKQNNNTLASYGASFTSGDVLGVALDMDAGTITFYKNNVSQGTAYTGLTGVAVPAVSGYNGSVSVMNFGQRPFSYTPPTGFKALNTQNLPAPTISNGALYMAATTYTGTGASNTISNGNNNTIGTTFKPDFVWAKQRGAATDHVLYDVIRTGTYSLSSNTTGAETNQTSNGCTVTFNSNGFTAGADTAGYLNYSGRTYVGWQWQAGAGTTSSNTNGSITSTVSVNATAGFSIVVYTGNGTNGATVGHGLGVKPSLIIEKGRSSAYNWSVQGCGVLWPTATQNLFLNTTNALNAGGAYGAPNSTTFYPSLTNYANENGVSNVAYCFAPVAGYSAFGSYTGNGSSDGPFVFLGFRPRYIMVKRTDASNFWLIMDSSRSTYNVMGLGLTANTSDAEFSWSPSQDFLSNGFKVRTSDVAQNASGGTYIYAAFAENPLKFSLAR